MESAELDPDEEWFENTDEVARVDAQVDVQIDVQEAEPPRRRMPVGTQPPPIASPTDRIELLLERSESTTSVDEQIQLLHEAAAIYERELGDLDSAFFVVQAAFNANSKHEHTARELERLATATDRWQEILDEYTKRAEELEPASLAALERLYRKSEAWEPLVDILSRRSELTTDDAELVTFQLEIGSISALRLSEVNKAIAAYRKVLTIDSANVVALRGLGELYEQTSQHDRYVEMLEAQAAASGSDAERVSLYERIAAVWEEGLGELGRAALAYEKILAIDEHSYATYHLLLRLYRQAGDDEGLIATCRRHLSVTTDAATRLDLCIAMGEAYGRQPEQTNSAIRAYHDALSLDATDERALDALARLFERIGDWHRAINMLERLAGTPDVYVRMAAIQYRHLRDAAGAEASLQQGLALAPDHMPTMEALTRQYSESGKWLEAAQMMVRAETFTEVPVDQARLLCAAANIYMYKLGAVDDAKRLYASVIELDPEHIDAGWPLRALYFKAEQWAELSPVIDMLCRKVEKLGISSKEQLELYSQAARCCEELGDLAKALTHYKAAGDLDATDVTTQVARAELLFKMKDWANADTAYQALVVQHRDGKLPIDIARMYNRLGTIRRARGERKRALHLFEQALEIDPYHHETLRAVIDLRTEQGEWEAVVSAKRDLMHGLGEHEKAKLLGEIGAVYRDRLQNPQKAAAAYLEALEHTAGDHELLQKALDLYTETKQWRRAVDMIERFAALESDPFRRGIYLHAAAIVCRDELSSGDEAVDHFEAALVSFFSKPDRIDEQLLSRALLSFEAIDAVHTAKRDWRAQERLYLEMIERLPEQGTPLVHKVRVGLLDALGEIYRSRLKQYDEATCVFETAQHLDPTNQIRRDGTDRAEIIAELCAMAGPDFVDKAVAQHQRMLRSEPFKYDSYKALVRLYTETNQHDKRWCVSNTLRFLKKASPDDLHFYEQYEPRGMAKPRSATSAESWAKLAHADENRQISRIFAACWQGVAAMQAFPHKAFGLEQELQRQLQGDSLMFSKLFLHAAQTLNVALPEVYVSEDDKTADLQLANVIVKKELCPAFVVRPHLLQGKSERDLAFLSARKLTFMRPEYYLRMLVPTATELAVAVLSAIVMVEPGFAVPANMAATVQQYLPKMQKWISAGAREQLAAAVAPFIKSAPDLNLARWGYAVDATAHRAGFVVSGDLEASARAIAAEPAVLGGPSVKDKIKNLVLFSISEEYFAVRAQMGLAITTPGS
jgi:tetratricopeptide (TPR) repeat protein